MPTLGFVKKFRKEFEDYIAGQRVDAPILPPSNLVHIAGASH